MTAHIPFPQYDKPGSKISPFTGKPYTAAEAKKTYAKTAAAAAAKIVPVGNPPGAAPKPAADPSKLSAEFSSYAGRMFGSKGDQATYDRLAKQVSSGAKTRDQALAELRTAVGYDATTRRAADSVNAEVDPLVDQLRRKARAEEEYANQQITLGQKDTDAYASSVDLLYKKLAEQLGAGNQQVQQGYQQAQGQTGSAYDQLIASLGETYGRATDSVSSEADRLGLSAATPQATEGLQRDEKFLSSLFGGQKQSALDTLIASGLISNQANNRFSGATAGQGAQYQVRAREDQLRNATDLRQTAGRNSLEYRGQAGDIDATRGSRIRENIAALTEAREQARSEAEAQMFEREILLEKLNLQRQELGIDAEYKAGQLDIDRQRLGIDQQRVNIEARKTEAVLRKEAAALDPNSLEYQEKMAAIDLKKAQTKKTIADYTKPADPAKFGKGRVGAEAYLSSLGDPGLVQAGMNEVTLAMQYGKDYPDAIRFMRNNFSKFSDLKDPQIQKALLNALDLAWEGSKAPGEKF